MLENKKKYLLSLLFLSVLFAMSAANLYAPDSKLSSGKWYKISVKETGVCKISYEELVSYGIANPANVRVFGYGGNQLPEVFNEKFFDDLPEVAVYRSLGEDNKFGPGDFILFYALGPVSWSPVVSSLSFYHTYNTYSFTGNYFLSSDVKGDAKKIVVVDKYPVSGSTVEKYRDKYVHETDQYNICNTGRKFLGEVFNQSKLSHTITINPTDVVPDDTAFIRLRCAHTSSSNAVMSITVNNSKIADLSLNTLPTINYIHGVDAEGSYSFVPNSGNRFNLNLQYSNASSTAYLDYYELIYNRYLVKRGGAPLYFNNLLCLKNATPLSDFKISASNYDVMVWDVTSNTDLRIYSFNYSAGYISFTDSTNCYREYVVVDPINDSFATAHFEGAVANQNLHALPQVDMVIISPEEFLSSARRLASAHEYYDALSVAVVTDDEVYNEFSSGTKDATAYRRLMKMLYDRADGNVSLQPKYLILFGDGSFDNREILKNNTSVNIYRLLTYQSELSFSDVDSYTTDDYFALLDDNSGGNLVSDKMNIAVGRIPVYDAAQAESVVDKIIRYISDDDLDDWKNQAIYLADDGDANEHIRSADTVCNRTALLYPELLIRKLYFDSYKQEVTSTGEYYPALRKEFLDYVQSGVLMVNYNGHGGIYGWANEQVLTVDDIDNFYNTRLPLWVTATCDFSRFDNFLVSAGEKLLTNPKGGAMGLVSTTRTVLSAQNTALNLALVNSLLKTDNTTLRPTTVGNALKSAKNSLANSYDSNRLSFILLGDPAVALNFPRSHKVVLDSINGNPASVLDTIGALDVVNISGSVVDVVSSDIDKNFNGFAKIVVFDKEEILTTLSNDGAEASPAFKYKYRPNPIFSGKVVVVNGSFNGSFIVPKDIRYNFGAGRMVLYAADSTRNVDANGTFDNFIIGGENPDAVEESEGPIVKLYLNTPFFVDGDKVNDSPLFIAEVKDESGINTIGSGIGHDIIVRLDDDPKTEVVLNRYYQSDLNSYTSGVVYYPFSNLSKGKHKLLFRVWDMQNNPSTAELSFVVDEKNKINSYDAFAYPNPAVDYSNFVISHNRPNQPLDMKIFVYDAAGLLLWSNSAAVVTDNSSQILFNFNVNEANLYDGFYLVKILLIDSNGNKTFKSLKLFVRKQ